MPHKTANTQAPATLPEAGFVRLATILKIYPIGRSTWWAGVKSGKYPAGVKIGANTTAWRVEDIRALLAKHTGAA
jgi:prophage regulatory protein